ncbi:MAG: hypothetical protein JHC85_03395 [Chthoniobacterales bacterium]|nr:hypothetical protein [Chthoniobacterales bacterium]
MNPAPSQPSAKRFSPARLACVLLALLPLTAAAQQANIWHLPASTQEGIPGTMRDPATPGASQGVTFYQGVWKGDGANQTGGYLVYRINRGGWQSVNPPAFAPHSDVGSGQSLNQFWKATFTMPATVGSTVEYYFIADFNNRTRTFVHSGNTVGTVESAAQANPFSFTVAPSRPVFTVNGANGDYSKSNFYLDENNDPTFPTLSVRVNPGIAAQVEVFTNLNNRDRANDDFNNDGIEDGIFPPDGNLTTAADTGAYFQAYAMADSNNDGTYELDLPVLKTGAYRVTARYRAGPNDAWTWLGSSGIRDHAVVVAPKIARDMRVYELHVANANATAANFAGRGTFEDLHDPAKRVNITWLQNLGVNWIWFQPFYPQGLEGRQPDPANNNQPYDPGSPYSIRNFWEINSLYTRSYNGTLSDPAANPANYTASMTAFRNFALAADQGGIQLMLDFPFNHTAPDVVLGSKGVEIFGAAGGWQPGDKIRDRVPGFFSTDGTGGAAAYSAPAQVASQIATAPDRNDFGKWRDVRDVFFGNYATLVIGDPSAETSRATTRNEGDWMDFGGMSATTRGVWRYFGEVLPYWIVQSGHRGYNSTGADGASRDVLDAAGIDGLRKDFGQGLPPQAMEYIINRTHEVKWNFVHMTESLDGEQVTYRSSRHFAVLNENIVFPLQGATTTSAYRSIIEGRRSAYAQSLVLLNNTSHDELPYVDPWEALIRYTTVSTTDGAPMLMYGQEIGTGQKAQDSVPKGGFDWYEENFGKFIPHFKKWNSMQPQWTAYDNNAYGVQFLKPAYAAAGHARAFSPALRSSYRWFLNPRGSDNPDPDIFAVAKYTSGNTPLAQQDVVLAFTSLDRNRAQENTFGLSAALADILGLQSGRLYNAKNIAAYAGRANEQSSRRDQWLWGAGFTRSQLEANGIYVALNPVPTTEATWATAPYEAKFLKVYDVTPPAGAPTGLQGPNVAAFAVGDSVQFSWSALAADAAGVVPRYEVIVTVNGEERAAEIVSGASYTLDGVNAGDETGISVRAVNPDNNQNKSPMLASSPTIRVLAAAGDEDGDGMRNEAEQTAGTNALDPSSRFAASVIRAPDHATVDWAAVPGRSYRVQYRESLGSGTWVEAATGLTSGPFVHRHAGASSGFYRVVAEFPAP